MTPLDAQIRQEPKRALQAMEVHEHWRRGFRGPENEPFYEMAFDFIADEIGPAPEGQWLVDAGCGSGTKSWHLLKRGYRVLGLDFSTAILDEARAAATRAGLASQLEFRRADLTQLDLPSKSVHGVVCWGVLMHIPAVESAVAELARVLKPGGILVVSEGNMRSLQAVTIRWLRRLLGRGTGKGLRAPAGLERWEETSSGRVMTRQADIPWLIREFERHGLVLVKRRSGQFSEIFTLLPWKPARLLVHAFNSVWFRFVRMGGPAFGNLLVFRSRD
jgi:SAM-dependent methyltransferase